MHKNKVSIASQAQRMLVSRIVIVTVKNDFATQIANGRDLDLRRGDRHHDDRRNAATTGRKRDALRMVTGRSANYPPGCNLRGKCGDLVVSATQLEGENGLQIFPLQLDSIIESP